MRISKIIFPQRNIGGYSHNEHKKGKTRSVGVNPLKAACSNGVYTCPHEPGLFTRIMPAIVMPLKMSRASNRLGVFAVMRVRLINWLTRTKIAFY